MNAWIVLGLAAVVTALIGWWVLRAWRKAPGPDPARAGPALIGVATAAVAALGLYMTLGRPDLPGQPFAARQAEIIERGRADPGSLTGEEALLVLADRARAAPQDPLPYFFSGQILAANGRDQEAARAFETALRRDPGHVPSAIELGRAIVRLDSGQVSPQALALFEVASQLTPEDPLPWFYQALAASQQQRWEDAARLWPEVQRRLPADDQRQQMAAQMLAQAQAGGGAQPIP